MAATGDLLIRIRADITNAQAGLRQLNQQITGTATALNQVGAASSGLTAAEGQAENLASTLNRAWIGGALLAGLGAMIESGFVGASRTAEDYEAAISQIAGLTDLSASAVQRLSGQVLQLSGTVSQSPRELAEGLYFVVSAGFAGSDAMTILATSARAASGGLGDTKTVADTVTSTLNAYKLGADQAANVTDILVNTVTQGKMPADQLASALGRVLPIAAAAGVSFPQVAASLATMTRTGLSSDEAVTALRGTLAALIHPGKQAEDTLKAMGLSAAALREEIQQKGLLATLADLMDRTGGDLTQLENIVPNIRALTGVLSTAGSQSDQYAKILTSMGNAAGRTDKAFEAAAGTVRFQAEILRNAVDRVSIAFGNLSSGPVLDVINFATQVLTAFLALPPSMQGVIFGALAIAGAFMILAGAMIFLGPGIAALPSALLVVGSVAGTVGGALLTLAVPLVLLIGAALLLYIGWKRNFLGIQEITRSVVDTINSLLDSIIRKLGEVLPFLGAGLAGIGKAVGGLAGSKATPGQGALDTLPADLAGINPLAGLVEGITKSMADAQTKIMAGLATALPNPTAGTGSGLSPGDDTGYLADLTTQLGYYNRQLRYAQDNLAGVRAQAEAATGSGLRPFAAQIDQIDKQIAGIELTRLEKVFDRLNRRPARTPGQELGRLNLERQILERQQTIATPLSQGAPAKQPAVIASEARVKAIQDEIEHLRDAIELSKTLATIGAGVRPGPTDIEPGRVNPFRDFTRPATGAGTGAFEPGAFAEVRFPSIGNTVNAPTTINLNAPLIAVASVSKEADEDRLAQKAVDLLLKAGNTSSNVASNDLPGAQQAGHPF